MKELAKQEQFQSNTLSKYEHKTALLYEETLKVRDFSDDSPRWNDFRMSLDYACTLVGCKHVSDEEYIVLKTWIREEYKDFSPEEILMAFKKLSSNKITVDTQHYGTFSAKYLGDVLTAFKAFRNKALSEKLKKQPKVEKEATEEEKKKIREEFLQRCLFKPYDEIEYSGTFDIDLHTCATLFRLFRRARLIECTPADGEKYEPLAIKSLEQEYKKDPKTNRPLRTFWERIHQMQKGKDQPISNRVTDRCQALYFVDYVLDLKSKNRDIRKIAERL